LETIIKLARVYDVPLETLVVGEPREPYGPWENFVSVPFRWAVPGKKAGEPPNLHMSDGEPKFVPVQKSVFQNHRGPFHAFRVQSDSMKPILHAEDIVIVAMGNLTLQQRPVMYAVQLENQTSVRYIQKQKNKYLLISLDPDVPIVEVELDRDPNPVLGEVIGAWKFFNR
jgi:SOS-response transcriptional repressor LexA